MEFLSNADFGKNQIINVRLDSLATAPASPGVGQFYFDTTLGEPRIWDGSNWKSMTSGDIESVLTPAGSGLTGGATTGVVTLGINVDNATLEISTNTVQLKNLGVTSAKIADANVTTVKILDKNVTFAKIQDIPTMTVIGKVTAGTGTATTIAILNEPTLASNSASSLPTQASVKAYVDSTVAAVGTLVGGFDAAVQTNYPSGSKKGDYWYVTVAGTVQGTVFNIGDMLVANKAAASTTLASDWIFLESNRDQATTTTLGVLRLATTAEAQGLTNTIAAITPATLATVTATETRIGLVELATTAEVVTGTDTVRASTPAGVKAAIDAAFSAAGYTALCAAATSTVVTHGLGTKNVVVSVVRESTGVAVIADWAATSTTAVTVTFATAPAAGAYRINIAKAV
ncbi:MAG: hypothetical protein V4663_05950 [Bacteroidota bacterium]